MSTELKNAVKAADAIPQYDMCVKRLLAEKNIIANILVNAVDVYKGMVPEDVVPYIEGELYISMVPVEPGLTNTAREENGQRVIGLNTENQEIHEGLIKFDIIFYAWEPIKTDPAASEEAPAEKNKGALNKMIGLSEELLGPEEGYELHRLLGALLSQKLTVEEKLTIMETEYHIPVEENLRKDVNVMCNLGEGIEEKAIAIGEARGEAKGEARGKARGVAETEARLVGNMHKNGFTAEQIAAATDMDIKDVEAILAGREPA